MKIILMIPILLSIVTASTFIATNSNNEVFAVCSEINSENSRNIHCNENYNYNSNTATMTTPATTEEVEAEEPSSGCMGLLCLDGGLLGSSIDTVSNPLGDISTD